MNVADSEVVASVMKESGYQVTEVMSDAELILINTCSIRENAEQKIWRRLDAIGAYKRKKPGTIVGIIGCMAERLKEKLIESDKLVDLVVVD